jgi:DNA-binding MarR family transcriptional regulator
MTMKIKIWLQNNKERRQKWLLFMQGFHPDIDPQSIRLLDELAFTARSLYSISEQSLEEAGLSFAQYRVLMHLFFAEQIGDTGQLNPSEISERQGVSRNTMSTFIRNLEVAGLVERRLDPEDRRRFNISITDKGRELVGQHTRAHLETIDRCFKTLDADEQQTLSVLLHKLGSQITAVQEQAQEKGL